MNKDDIYYMILTTSSCILIMFIGALAILDTIEFPIVPQLTIVTIVAFAPLIFVSFVVFMFNIRWLFIKVSK